MNYIYVQLFNCIRNPSFFVLCQNNLKYLVLFENKLNIIIFSFVRRQLIFFQFLSTWFCLKIGEDVKLLYLKIYTCIRVEQSFHKVACYGGIHPVSLQHSEHMPCDGYFRPDISPCLAEALQHSLYKQSVIVLGEIAGATVCTYYYSPATLYPPRDHAGACIHSFSPLPI